MSEMTGNVFDVKIFKRVLKYVRPYRKQFNFTALLTIILAFLGPSRPLLVKYTVDNSIIIPDSELLIKLTLAMVALVIIETIVQFYQTYMANWVGQSVIKDLREETFHKISAFKLKYFDQTPIGTMVTRVVSDIETIADLFSNGILIIIGDIMKLLVVIIIMFITDWRLALLSLASIPLLLVATKMFNKSIKSAFQDVRTEVSRLNAFIQEHLTGMSIVQIFNREQKEYEKFKGINKKHRNAHVRTVWANAIFFPIVELFSATSLALLVWLGSKGIIDEKITFGSLLAFILYIHMLFRPIRQLADRFNTLQLGMVSSERVFRVLDTDAKIENTGNIILNNPKGLIDFKNVWFAYNEPEWILRDINFTVAPGEKVALVGPTGAGKSSIINLLGRFYEYQKGSVSIDGNLIQDIDLQSLRKHVGIVVQDVFLFSDTIYNNITLNNPRISMEEVRTAAKEIGADDFIMRLPGDYQYAVGERGGTLSVGQRQLLAFIRAYLYNPGILILDEATSSVDTESEEMIQKATEKITENRTSIIIAHRLATIQKSDRIMIVDDGKIIESGSHSELLKKNGFYKNLYDMQFATELES
ncbi:MAG: ABC transporter ATP-binding protein [Salibacteraceae bacterium]|nr:ABC transporter ATP-binding protein [Salibacteraceae bacterium]|tara:strand:- start:27736 stop:29496 length:1761 start_codon:yes stop_codon:yes gene_type:complete